MSVIKYKRDKKSKWDPPVHWETYNDPKWPIDKFCKDRGCLLIGPARHRELGLGWLMAGGMNHKGQMWWGFIDGLALEQELFAVMWTKKKRRKKK